MKKLFVSILLIGAFVTGYSQEFMGIKVDGSKQSVISQFKAKGFSVSSDKDNVVLLKGSINGINGDVYCSFTPKTNKCWKFSVFLAEQSSWYSLKSQYEKYVALFTDKYGVPDKNYSFFSSPYYEGDGYEMSAVALDKCVYASFWSDMYSVQISKWKQIKLGYENPLNSKLDDEEKNAKDKAIF